MINTKGSTTTKRGRGWISYWQLIFLRGGCEVKSFNFYDIAILIVVLACVGPIIYGNGHADATREATALIEVKPNYVDINKEKLDQATAELFTLREFVKWSFSCSEYVHPEQPSNPSSPQLTQ